MEILSLAGRSDLRASFTSEHRSVVSPSFLSDCQLDSHLVSIELNVTVRGQFGAASLVVLFEVRRVDGWDVVFGEDVLAAYSGLFVSSAITGKLRNLCCAFLTVFKGSTVARSDSSFSGTASGSVPPIPARGVNTHHQSSRSEIEHYEPSDARTISAQGETVVSSVATRSSTVSNGGAESVTDGFQLPGSSSQGRSRSRCAAVPVTRSTRKAVDSGSAGESIAVNVMNAMFFGRGFVGERTYLFTDDIIALSRLAALHGLRPNDYGGVTEIRCALLSHILLGDCFRAGRTDAAHARPLLTSTQTCCSRFAHSYVSGKSLSLECLRFLQSFGSKVAHLTSQKLLSAVRSLGYGGANSRTDMMAFLDGFVERLDSSLSHLDLMKDLPASYVLMVVRAHRIPGIASCSTKQLRCRIQEHFTEGVCALVDSSMASSDDHPPSPPVERGTRWLDEYLLSMDSLVKRMPHRACKQLIVSHGLMGDIDTLRSCRKIIREYIATLRKGKRQAEYVRQRAAERREEQNDEVLGYKSKLQDIENSWPVKSSGILKERLLSDFLQETGSDALRTATCAVCAVRHPYRDVRVTNPLDCDLTCLRVRNEADGTPGTMWEDTSVLLPYCSGPLAGLQLDPRGVEVRDDGAVNVSVCLTCHKDVKKGKIPKFSLANGLFLGNVPKELQDLTIIEESMIALCRSKCYVIQLKDDSLELESGHVQRGMKGHVIVYPQRPSHIATSLPPDIEEITSPICVLFVGSEKPSDDWLRNHAKPLAVNGGRVRRALQWLKDNNPLYSSIEFNEDVLRELDRNPILPISIQHVLPSSAGESLTSRYDAPDVTDRLPIPVQTEVPFQNVVITDVDGGASSNNLRAAAVRHIKWKGGGYIEINHDPVPVEEFYNPRLFPMMYPTLFPYGIGGMEDRTRVRPISLKRHVKHLFELNDTRFQQHHSFLFSAFNMLQRRSMLLHTSLKVKKASFPSIAKSFARVSADAIHIVAERVSRGDFTTCGSEEEKRALTLMKEVRAVTSNVSGSSSSCTTMRNEIRGLMMDQGLPSFYITINPADVYSPVVKFLAGEDIDINNLLPSDVPKYHDQSILIAKNPAVAARFFNIYMKAFIKCMLGYTGEDLSLNEGVLGVTKAYYGCVEAQGRGTLHCHMLVWLHGALDPNEIKKRVMADGDEAFRDKLLSFLDDSLSNHIPDVPMESDTVLSDGFHAAAVRGNDTGILTDRPDRDLMQRDLHNLVVDCQVHKHTKTCYKYWRYPEPRTCRFDLDEQNTCPESYFDYDKGELCLRCMDGLVNNFNDTILRAVRCNMDIKFVGSGASAKAVLLYHRLYH